MNIYQLQEAEHKTIHEFRFTPKGKKALRGAIAVSFVTGIPAGTLSNNVNANMRTHKLGHIESVIIQRMTEDHRMHEEDAHFLGRLSIKLGNYENVSDVEILSCYTRLIKEVGEHASAIEEALADGEYTAAEHTKITREWEDVLRVAFELHKRLEKIIDKPDSEAA